MVRKLIPALVLLASHFPGNAFALGVGEIHLESALNQEFDAYIDLLSVKTDELDGVKIKLATPEAFERAGIDRPFILSKLRFVPEIGPKGDAIVRVTSREPIREPFLNFLIEVNWAKGRLVREYTVLLDPPVTLERKPAPVSQPTTTAPSPQAEPAPAEQVAVAETPAAVVSEPGTAAQSEYGPVQATDTLWTIAKSVRPEGTSIHQMMIALQRSNPHAFINNNVNNLKKGVILRIPSREEVEQLSRAEAQAAFQDQMEEWRASRSGAVVSEEVAAEQAPAAPMPEVTPEPEPEAAKSEAQLKLVSARPEGEGEEGASEGETDAERQVARLENSLALAQEEAASAKRESQELNSRVKELEEQLSKMNQREQLVTVRDEQLAALQAGAAQEEQAAKAEAPAVAEKPKAAVEEAKPAAPAKPKKAPAPQAKAPAPAAEPAPPRKRTSASTVDQILAFVSQNQTAAMGAGGGLLVLILLLLLLRRRKAGAEEFEESVLVTPDEEAAAPQVAEELPEEEEGVGGETSLLSDFATSDMDALQDDTGEVDPVAEADVYIAYGRFQQAEELVSQAIEREPGRLSLKHKLLEIYSASGNKDAFVKLAEEMSAQGAEQADSAAWAKACAMGVKLAPAHALFAGAEAAAAESLEASDSVDAELDELATDLGLGEETESTEAASEEPLDDFSDLDLDVGEDMEGLEGLETEAGGDEGLDLDFDLDLGEEPTAEEAPDLGEGLSLEPESEEEADLGLGDLNADDLMPEQLVEEGEAEEASSSADDLAAELAELSLDMGEEAESGGPEAELPALDEDLDLGSVEGLDLGEDQPELDADLGEDLSAGLDFDAGEEGEELPDLGGLDLGEEAESEDLDQVLSSVTEEADQKLDLDEEDLEQTLSSLTDGLDLELDAQTEDLEQTLSSLSGDLDLGDAGDIEDLEQTLSGFSEGLTQGEEGAESDDLSLDLSEMEGALGEESASTQLLDEALEEEEDTDEVTTKLDLAKAYVEMGDSEGARSILEEALAEGNDQQKTEAQALLDQLS